MDYYEVEGDPAHYGLSQSYPEHELVRRSATLSNLPKSGNWEGHQEARG